MTRARRTGVCLVLAIVCIAGTSCHLQRPPTPPARMIEPQVLEPQQSDTANPSPKEANAAPVRLLDTQARGHIGRRLLRQQANGELTEDPVWRWSSNPDRYLDTALRSQIASSPNVQLVDTDSATAVAATLLVWDLESAGSTQLVGAAEFQITGPDRLVHTQIVRGSEPVSAELPGDLAAAAGRLMRRLASDGLQRVAKVGE